MPKRSLEAFLLLGNNLPQQDVEKPTAVADGTVEAGESAGPQTDVPDVDADENDFAYYAIEDLAGKGNSYASSAVGGGDAVIITPGVYYPLEDLAHGDGGDDHQTVGEVPGDLVYQDDANVALHDRNETLHEKDPLENEVGDALATGSPSSSPTLPQTAAPTRSPTSSHPTDLPTTSGPTTSGPTTSSPTPSPSPRPQSPHLILKNYVEHANYVKELEELENGMDASHVHEKHSQEKNGQNPDKLPDPWDPPPEPMSVEAAPRAPGDDDGDDEGKINCKSNRGKYGGAPPRSGVIMRYQYEITVDTNVRDTSLEGDVLPSLETAITDSLLSVFFGEECLDSDPVVGADGADPERQLSSFLTIEDAVGPGLMQQGRSSLRGRRRLNKVVGIDSMPVDFPLPDEECSFDIQSTDTLCHTVEGSLTLYFPPNYSISTLIQGAQLTTLNAIGYGMASGSLAANSHLAIVRLKLLDSSYSLRPILPPEPEAMEDEGGGGKDRGKSGDGGNVGLIVGVLVPLILICCCCSFLVLWMRRGGDFGDLLNRKSSPEAESEEDDNVDEEDSRRKSRSRKQKKKRKGKSKRGRDSEESDDYESSGSELDSVAQGLIASKGRHDPVAHELGFFGRRRSKKGDLDTIAQDLGFLGRMRSKRERLDRTAEDLVAASGRKRRHPRGKHGVKAKKKKGKNRRSASQTSESVHSSQVSSNMRSSTSTSQGPAEDINASHVSSATSGSNSTSDSDDGSTTDTTSSREGTSNSTSDEDNGSTTTSTSDNDSTTSSSDDSEGDDQFDTDFASNFIHQRRQVRQRQRAAESGRGRRSGRNAKANSGNNNLIIGGHAPDDASSVMTGMTGATGMHSLSSQATEQVRNMGVPYSVGGGDASSVMTGVTGVSGMTQKVSNVAGGRGGGGGGALPNFPTGVINLTASGSDPPGGFNEATFSDF